MLSGLLGGGGGVEYFAQVRAGVALELLAAGIDLLAERGVRFIEPRAHPDILRALAGEDEDDGPLAQLPHARSDAPRVAAFEYGDGFFAVARDNGAPVLERPPSDLQRVGDVAQRLAVAIAAKVREQVGRRSIPTASICVGG